MIWLGTQATQDHSVPAPSVSTRFQYADGAEALLHDIFERDDFDEQHTWMEYNWWPLSYHLSPARANIISWLPSTRQNLHVLEVGAGCGAITSYLCRVPSIGHIVAVEGAPRIEEHRALVHRQPVAQTLRGGGVCSPALVRYSAGAGNA